MFKVLKKIIPGLLIANSLSAQGIVIDSVNLPALPADMSFDRSPDSSEHWLYFRDTTPGEMNGATRVKAIFWDLPQFSLPCGLYSESFRLALSSAVADKIFYTLDGAMPDENSTLFTTELILSAPAVVRARSMLDGVLSERTATASYIIDKSTNLPVISIVAKPQDLWGDSTGIYTNWQSEREIPVHLDFFETDGVNGFSLDAGMKIFGGWSRNFPQKSLAIFARKKYGASKLKYQLFPDLQIDEFEAFILRNAGGNFGASHYRDPLMHRLIADLDLETQAYRPAVLYLNGVYWGIMNIREKINEHYLESHFAVASESLNMLENNAEVIDGENTNYLALQAFLQSQDMAQVQNYDYVKSQIDIDNYLDYLTSEIYFANVDWPGWNLKYWRPQAPGGKWRWIIFDLDDGFGWGKPQDYGYRNMFDFVTTSSGEEWPNPPWSTSMLRAILQNERFVADLLNRFADHLNTIWQPHIVLATIDSMQNHLSAEMPHHINRWKNEFTARPMSMGNWQNFIDDLREFGRSRPAELRQVILAEFNLDKLVALKVKMDPVAGSIRINHDIAIADSSWQGWYFSGLPVTLTAEPQPGFLFKSWQGDTISTANEIELIFSDSAIILAEFTTDNSTIPAIVINEINYHSAADFASGDWFELFNNQTGTVDLSGWIFIDENEAHRFIFPAGTQLSPGDYLVVCRDTLAFSRFFPQIQFVEAQLDFGLANSGEVLRLYDLKGRRVDSLCYSDDPPWPQAADGAGPTLSLISPGLDNLLAENWRAFAGHGSPGSANGGPDAVAEVIKNQGFQLRQNYPNPFRHTTTICFRLPVPAKVDLIIYNVLGQKILSLVHGNLQTGEYKVHWQPAESVVPGIYLMRLQAGNFNAVRKLIYY